MNSWTGDLKAMFTAPVRDKFNYFMRVVCRPIYAVTHRRILHGQQHAMREGGYLVVANHTSPFDIPGLMYGVPRIIDFVSIVEVMGVPGVGAFYKLFNTITLDRGKVDAAAVRTIVSRLQAGRVVCMFPEGKITPEEDSVLHGGEFRSGFGRIARLADVPVIPTLILDTAKSSGVMAWLPFSRTRFYVAFGEPLFVREDLETRAAQKELEERWREAVVELARRLDEHRHD
ncbi:lysophospholipid acyltransferase family protein [Algisphaera agarilytica]|uniref:1-acyl-sn-glycerol-3-phosphate acyltransferase n=1 Tax=Algisphaera agarilytica TaxID=1385975 RepID=A0A7X0H3X7_9BACT|nr:lysophospholipid acyltransferase family protein [Algisphaera agarilytica]MBB6428816.1 1-acyl-sn-glycerol-3-phosphate acyltransferase [Algisphaera agarilytica]